MSHRTLTSPSKSVYLSPKYANTSGGLKTTESFAPEEDEKAFHVADINSKYQKRLMKPLQLNQRLKLQQEMTNFESERHFYKRKFVLPSNEDLDKKHLIDQIQELAKISAYHDREAGAFHKDKKSKKLLRKFDVLQQHLDADLYHFLQDVNTRVNERQKQRIRQDLEKEAQNLLDGTIQDDPRSPKNIIHKQIEAIRESKEKKLVPKQLNSNNYFRHSQRKLLYLRTAEAMNEAFKQEEASEKFFMKEAQEAKQKKKAFQNSLTRSDLFSSKRTNTRAEKSVASLSPHKMTQSALAKTFNHTAQGFNLTKKRPSELTDLGLLSEETLKTRNSSTPFVNHAFTTPFEMNLNHLSQSQPPFNLNLASDEGSPGAEKRNLFRKSSQPTAEAIRKSISLANEHDEVLSQRIPSTKLMRLETKVSMVDEGNPQEEESPLLYPATTEPQDKISSRNLRKVESKNARGHRQRSVAEEAESQKKESFRSNLLENIKRTKISKAPSFSEQSENIFISPLTSPTSHKSPTVNEDMSPVSKFRLSRTKNPNEETGKKRNKKRGSGFGSYSGLLRSSHHHFNTEQTDLARELSEEKKPLKEEMEHLLTR